MLVSLRMRFFCLLSSFWVRWRKQQLYLVHSSVWNKVTVWCQMHFNSFRSNSFVVRCSNEMWLLAWALECRHWLDSKQQPVQMFQFLPSISLSVVEASENLTLTTLPNRSEHLKYRLNDNSWNNYVFKSYLSLMVVIHVTIVHCTIVPLV